MLVSSISLIFISFLNFSQALRVIPENYKQEDSSPPDPRDAKSLGLTEEQFNKHKDYVFLERFCSSLEKILQASDNDMQSIQNITQKFRSAVDGTIQEISTVNCSRFDVLSKEKKLERYDRQFDVVTPSNWHRAKVFSAAKGAAKGNDHPEAKEEEGNAFKIVFQCGEGIEQEMCDKAEKSYHRVTKEISEHLKVERKIVLKAEFISFCVLEQESCDQGILGQAAPASFWAVDKEHAKSSEKAKIDSNFWYPQPLVKQLLKDDLEWGEYDVIAQFNSDPTPGTTHPIFWFPGDEEMSDDQYDFEYVVYHEIMHGLGFSSAWNMYIPMPKSDKMAPMLTPQYRFYQDESGQTIVDGIQPLTIFDKFIHLKSTGQPLASYYYIFAGNGLGKVNQPFSQWRKKFMKSRAKTEAEVLYKLAVKPDTFEFRFPNKVGCFVNARYSLHTRYKPFLPGSSFSHLDQQKYKDNTKAYLMRPEVDNGILLKDIGKNTEMEPIGDAILGALELMGYNIKYDSELSQCAKAKYRKPRTPKKDDDEESEEKKKVDQSKGEDDKEDSKEESDENGAIIQEGVSVPQMRQPSGEIREAVSVPVMRYPEPEVEEAVDVPVMNEPDDHESRYSNRYSFSWSWNF